MISDNNVFPVLKTPRLELAALTGTHISDLFRLFTDKQVTAYFPVIPLNEENDMLPVIESFNTRFKEQQGIRWGISLKGRKELIGTIGYHYYVKGHKGSIVFALSPAYQRQGYITEAIKEVLRYGFEQLSLQRIEAEVIPGNIASENVLEKTGFSHEGLLRQWMQWNGKYYDVNMFAITRKKP